MRKSASVLAIFSILVVACASSKTPPRAATPAGQASLDATEEEDQDGEVDAEDEAPADEAKEAEAPATDDPCPAGTVLVDTSERRFCIDKYEASLVEVAPDGSEKPHPHYLPVDGKVVRAVSAPDVFPQGFISEVQANDACVASQKRLCTHVEWKTACMGPQKTKFPYGDERKANVCHDSGKSAVVAVFGAKALTDPVSPTIIAANAKRDHVKTPDRKAHVTVKGKASSTTRERPSNKPRATAARSDKKNDNKKKSPAKKDERTTRASKAPAKSTARASTRPPSIEESVWNHLNDPALGKVDGALAKTGSHPECVNGFGAVDMVGNLHEWVATDPNAVHGTFAGGYYLDTSQNGDGCQYRTVAHAHDYHDYSTGFRCCADAK